MYALRKVANPVHKMQIGKSGHTRKKVSKVGLKELTGSVAVHILMQNGGSSHSPCLLFRQKPDVQ